jgi:hypothetical protein
MKTIKLGSQENLIPFLTLVYAFGFKHYNGHSLNDCIRHYQREGYDYFFLDASDMTLKGKTTVNDFDYDTQLNKIVEWLVNPTKVITITDVGSYEAIVSETGVKVGCQNISFEKVEEIFKAIQSLKK